MVLVCEAVNSISVQHSSLESIAGGVAIPVARLLVSNSNTGNQEVLPNPKPDPEYDTLTGVKHGDPVGYPDPLTAWNGDPAGHPNTLTEGGNSDPNRVDPVNLYDDLGITLPIGLSSPENKNEQPLDNPYVGTSCLQTKEEEQENDAELAHYLLFGGGNTNLDI
jgi:hypothetical protein